MGYALVLACDLTPDGRQLGPRTILRLERAIEYVKKTGDFLVVAASRSPGHPMQPKPMASMMADWLREKGVFEICTLTAQTFNTRGELKAFFTLPETSAIISAPWHLRRVRLLVWQEKGWCFMRRLKYVSVPKNTMSTKERFVLEPLKFMYEGLMLVTPAKYRVLIWKKVTGVLRRFTNPSW